MEMRYSAIQHTMALKIKKIVHATYASTYASKYRAKQKKMKERKSSSR